MCLNQPIDQCALAAEADGAQITMAVAASVATDDVLGRKTFGARYGHPTSSGIFEGASRCETVGHRSGTGSPNWLSLCPAQSSSGEISVCHS